MICPTLETKSTSPVDRVSMEQEVEGCVGGKRVEGGSENSCWGRRRQKGTERERERERERGGGGQRDRDRGMGAGDGRGDDETRRSSVLEFRLSEQNIAQ